MLHDASVEAIIFVGLQASGKLTFYKQRFFDTHIRINLDMLRTRERERTLLQACIEMKQRFVVDNTNPTQAVRAPYIAQAKAEGFSVVGYYFRPDVAGCLARNNAREGAARIPTVGIYAAAKRLQTPSLAEGFDTLYCVRIEPGGGFAVEEWAKPEMSQTNE